MQWILLLLIVAALLYLSRYYPRVAFGVLGVLVVGVLAFVLVTDDLALRKRSGLPADAIVIENTVVSGSYAGGFRFNARLVNHHPSLELKESVIGVTMLDCPGDSDDNCQVIGQQDRRVLVRIPPGQARDVGWTESFGNARPVHRLAWRYRIMETRT